MVDPIKVGMLSVPPAPPFPPQHHLLSSSLPPCISLCRLLCVLSELKKPTAYLYRAHHWILFLREGEMMVGPPHTESATTRLLARLPPNTLGCS